MSAISMRATLLPAARVNADDAATRQAARACTLMVLLSTTVLARFGVNVGGESIAVSMAGLCLLVAVLVLTRRAELDIVALLLYGLVLVAAYASWYFNTSFGASHRASLSSLLYLFALYLPLVFVQRIRTPADHEWRWTMRAFGNIALLCALAGIAQFFAQFAIDAPWLIDFGPYLPAAIRNSGTYNTAIPVGDLFKSNGFFLREPSAFSFLMALATIVELNGDRRWLRICAFLLALLLTYSGTGVLALLLGLLFPLGSRTAVRLAAVAVGGAIVIVLLGEALNLTFTLNRIQEFGSERSSAYIRYVAPWHVISQSIDSDPWSALFGHGPGSIQRTSQAVQAFDPTWAKLLFEYGLIGWVTTVGLVVYALARSKAPTQIRAVLFFSWLLMGGHLLAPDNVSTLYVLACMWHPHAVAFESAHAAAANALSDARNT